MLYSSAEEYYSLRLNSSDDIADIPDDEVLLGPKLTEDIKNENIIESLGISKTKTESINSDIKDFVESN